MIRWPWQRWEKPAPPDPKAMAESEQAVKIALSREYDTSAALRRRRAVIVHNHIANDIRRAMGRHP